ncbi:MAG TPA: PilZ domain-containing protein [Kofleriaceae bacterium]|nr:PilZ domain-containing protein [Kofleriaceae bacterium]
MTRFPPPPPGAERRAHPRHDVVVSVELAHDDTIAIASLLNISHGGAFVELDDLEAIAIGVRVRIQLAVDGLRASELARVVRVSSGAPTGFALAWSEPGAAIARIVEHLTATAPQAAAG